MDNITKMTTAELKEYAKVNNIPLNKLSKKPEIINEINAVLKTRTSPAVPSVEAPKSEGINDIPSVTPDVKTGLTPHIKGMRINRELKVTKPLMKGADVMAVQSALIVNNFHCGVNGANGIYGAETAYAVRIYQSMNRLIVSGKVDKFTAQKMGAVWEGPLNH